MATARHIGVPNPPVIQVDLTWDEAAMIVAVFGKVSRSMEIRGGHEGESIEIQRGARRALDVNSHYDVYAAIKEHIKQKETM
mgnify:CR=1 FL=1